MKRLNIGCGEWPLYYWINLDANPAMRADIHATVPPIPFEDEELDEIYAGHMLEHLDSKTARVFLSECYRCLKHGGRLGLVVPDTREIMRRWLNGAIDCVEFPENEYWAIDDLDAVCALFLYSTAQSSPHKWSYDSTTLARIMREAGFVDLCVIDRYRDPRISVGAWYQCGWDGAKP